MCELGHVLLTLKMEVEIHESRDMGGLYKMEGSPGCSVGTKSACNVGHPDSIPGSRRSPGEGNGPLQYPCLENPMDGGAW